MQTFRFLAYFFAVSCFLSFNIFGQGTPPWQMPLMTATSTDGITFAKPTIFQDSSGVPSLIRWKGDTLVAVFQWFRQPMQSLTWDKVAVKFSYNNGQTWTTPTPIIINNLPANYQRPFDPTLAVVDNSKLRIYFSSSEGLSMGGLTNIVDTYSAISSDGLRYTFEPKARFDSPITPVIDPAILFFNNKWHYAAPKGSPQAGAYHATSSDGLTFTQEADYSSDAMHNWTGNFMLENPSVMRFYGSGQKIWFNSTTDGFSWRGYTDTNLIGGDPSVCKLPNNSYLAIFVGQPYSITANEDEILANKINVYPTFTNTFIKISTHNQVLTDFILHDLQGRIIKKGALLEDQTIYVEDLQSAMYLLTIHSSLGSSYFKIIKY